MAVLHPDFELVAEGQAVSPRGGIVDVSRTGAAGVVGAILAAESGADAWLLRDPSAPPPAMTENGRLWLQTSGTTGTPKWAGYRIGDLAARIAPGKGGRARWLLTYHPGAFAGVQVILSAMAGGHVLVAPPGPASARELAELAASHAVTHISGTPTFWRAFLVALGSATLRLRGVTLGGEAADQAILDSLKARFPDAALRHIYATTEAGTVFTVADGQAGFPRAWLGQARDGLTLSLSPEHTLCVENARASEAASGRIWDTGDVVEVSGDRVLFQGRADTMVNVGGVKVFPETVEAHLLALPFIQDVRVTARPNPITGQTLVADIVLKPFSGEVEAGIKTHLASLPRASRPALLRYVEALETGTSGKKLRTGARP